MVEIPVSVGELIDKISILEIKSERITDTDKLINVRRELDCLLKVARDYRVPDLERPLKQVNEQLWDVENALRVLESKQDFGDYFIELGRSVYVLNDQRAAIKKQINVAVGSALVEEKSYAELP
jgi:SMC interacting uncharacterized protein involved in chromosome segregation